MCGIIGFVGKEPAAPILLDGLARMEYRGYDSAGVAVRSETAGLQIRKTKGRLQVLSDLIHGGADLDGSLGIGHTRWATHGEPNDINAHPHVSENGRIALVHNGIIENYMELKEHLMRQGVHFTSDTDTEVVAQLLEFHYNECHNMLEAVGRCLRRIEGSYAFGIICADYPNALIAARKDSPLIIGYGKNGNFIASDVTAIIKYTRDVAYMDDGEIAVLTADSVDVFDDEMSPVEKAHSTIDWDVSAAEKGGYAHFMAKEIMEQPEAIRKTVSPRIRDGRVVLDDLHLPEEYVRGLSRIFVIACGSSYHVGVVSKYIWEKLLRRPVEVVLASEFRYSDPLVDERTLVIVISQSGETLDTMAAMREAKRRGGRTLAIVNVVGSSIAREADDVLYTWAGPEIAVATTKAYSTQLVLMDLVGLYLAEKLGTVAEDEYEAILSEMQLLPDKMQRFLDHTEDIQYFASRYFNHDSVFFIGRNLDYAMGLEGSLKLKEISYIHSEAYASGELKHGTISLIESGHPGGGPGDLCPALRQGHEQRGGGEGPGRRGAGPDHGGFPGEDGKDRRRHHRRTGDAPPAPALPGRGAAAAVRLLRGPPAGLRHRQAQEPGQERHRGVSAAPSGAASPPPRTLERDTPARTVWSGLAFVCGRSLSASAHCPRFPRLSFSSFSTSSSRRRLNLVSRWAPPAAKNSAASFTGSPKPRWANRGTLRAATSPRDAAITRAIRASSPAVEMVRKYCSHRSPSMCPSLWASHMRPSSSPTNTSPASTVNARQATAYPISRARDMPALQARWNQTPSSAAATAPETRPPARYTPSRSRPNLWNPFTAPQTKVSDSSASQAGSSWSRQAAESSWLTSTTAFPARRAASASTSRSRSSRTRCRSRTCFRSSLRSIQSPSVWGPGPHIRFS